jgi:hypothetical protein
MLNSKSISFIAVAVVVLLARYGYAAVVHVGVAKPETDMKSFQSHAWFRERWARHHWRIRATLCRACDVLAK